MSCTSNEANDIYDFFNNIDKYIKEAMEIEKPIPANTPLDECDNYSNIHSLGNKEKANILCNNFSRLNKFLVSIKNEVHSYCNFLNYWFNSELSQTWFSKKESISDVYNGMETYLYTNQEYSPLNCELCNINKDELNKMKILYNLHEKRIEIHNIVNSQEQFEENKLHEPSTECFTNYNKGLAMCNNKEEKFCMLLENFKAEYRKLYPMVEKKGHDYSKYFKRLSGNENSNVVSTAVTGSIVGLIPLFAVLYKFTPMGEVLRS
ncbi:PIR protein, partial [Plasmodium vivax]